MYSSRTSRALLVVLSSSSVVLSFPSSSALSSIAKRSFSDYVDNLIYLNSNKSALYAAISIGEETYAAYLDNKWDGLLVHSSDGWNSSAVHNETIANAAVNVNDMRTEVGFLEEDVQLEWFKASDWPSTIPQMGVSDIGDAYLGLDINNGMSPIYSYFAAVSPNVYANWYYDIMLTYDWADTNATSGVDFAGVMTAGKPLDWSSFLGISASEVQSYGLPDLSAIDNQPTVALLDDGTIYIDGTFVSNGQNTTATSQVPKADSGFVVADVNYSQRWSMFPDSIVSAIYSGISGATYVPQSTYGYWQIPCSAQPSMTFSIEGAPYAVSSDALVAPNPWGSQCIGSIMTKGQAVSAAPAFDIILGFQFLSGFYTRAGVNLEDPPYYKFLPLQIPSGGLNTGNITAPSMSYATGSGTLAPSATPTSQASASVAPTTSNAVSSSVASAASAPASSAVSAPASSGTPATKAAENLAETGSDDEDASYWKNQAKIFTITTGVLAGVLVLGAIGAVAFFFTNRRNAKARPSAYSTIHEAESHEPKASLYDAEGGHSRYSDPYQDTH